MRRSWEKSVLVVLALAAVLWAAGILFLLADGAPELQRLGLLLIVVAALVTALGLLHSWQMRMRRAFVHGYHAGYHDAAKAEPPDVRQCAVLDLSEVKARRLSRLG